MARITVGRGWPAMFESEQALYSQLRRELAAADEQIVVLRVPSNLARTSSAIPAGRMALFAGTLMYWGVDLVDDLAETLPDGLSARALSKDEIDVADLREMIVALGDSLDGYLSHYASNPFLDSTLVAAGYLEWAERTVTSGNGAAYLLERAGRIVGVATVRAFESTPSVCEVELAGMVSGEQGLGQYRHLLLAVMAGEMAKGRKSLTIATQSHNIRVQRAWAAIGLRPLESVDTFHVIQTVEAAPA